MRNFFMLGGLALALVGSVSAVEVGAPGDAAQADTPPATNTLEPQPIATLPVAGAMSPSAFVPPVPMVTAASVTQAVPVMPMPPMTHEMPGMAGPMPMPMPMPANVMGDMSVPSTKALVEANMKMHAGMNGPFTGDADVDFVKGMIAHHQGAIDMAKVELTYGKDPDMKMLANDIMKAQGKEIEQMQNWLELHGPKAPAAKAEAPKGKPKPPVMKAKAKPISQMLNEGEAPAAKVAEPAAKPAVAAPSAEPKAAAGAAIPPAGTEMQMPLLDDTSAQAGANTAR